MDSSLLRVFASAARLGAAEVRIEPGRPARYEKNGQPATEQGESIGEGTIDDWLDSLLTPEARMDLALGKASWRAQVPDIGSVDVAAELRMGTTHLVFRFEAPQPNTGSGVSSALSSGSPVVPERSVPPPRYRPAGTSGAHVVVPTDPVITQAAPPTRESAPQPARERSVPPSRQVTAPPPSGGSLPPASAKGEVREIERLLVATLKARGSDLHLTSGMPPMIRVDGEMQPLPGRGPLGSRAIEDLLAPIVPERVRAEFQRRRDADFAHHIEGQGRFRGNLFVDRNGTGAVFRVIPTQILPAEKLGLSADVLRLCDLPKGLVLVTGPTGAGKSTTLASLIDYVNRSRSGHIVTIEDPVEFVFENKRCLVNQREVGTHTESFRGALRAALREDPDVILVGELRDLETIEMALETAETGHLVFATLHTSSAPSTIDRIIDQFPAERQNQIRIMLAESLKGVIAQMLCKRSGGGRIAAFEILFGVPAVAHLIREKKVYQLQSVMQTGAKSGMRTMNDSLLDLVRKGLVSPDEALLKTQDRSALVAAFREAQIGAS